MSGGPALVATAESGPSGTPLPGISAPGHPRPVTPVGILVHRLSELAARCDAASGVDPSLTRELREIRDLAAGLDPYLERWTTPESSALSELARRTQEQDWVDHPGAAGLLEQEMLSGHVEGQMLKMLVHATGAQRVLEIGMFTGYSALAMAEALPDGGRVIACEIDPDVAAFAQRCFRESVAGDRITVEVGPAIDTLSDLSGRGEVFDLIFIDADKSGYAAYLDAILDGALLAPSGLVCVDNTLMQGQPWTASAQTPNGTAIAHFNERVAADPRVEQVVLPLRDGLTLIRRVDTSR